MLLFYVLEIIPVCVLYVLDDTITNSIAYIAPTAATGIWPSHSLQTQSDYITRIT